jgi:hypothetical protein
MYKVWMKEVQGFRIPTVLNAHMAQQNPVLGSCECGDEHFGSIRGRDISWPAE